MVRSAVAAGVMLVLGAQAQRGVDEPGVSGYVLASDGTPVSGGTVIVQSGYTSPTAPIDGTGRFRVLTNRAGPHQFVVSVPGLAPYRLNVTVPASRSLRLPVIRLREGASFRVRFVSTDGEPIIPAQLIRRFYDATGRPIFDGLGDRTTLTADSDGALTVGPLPRGIMTVAVDMPPFARTRLPDVIVSEAKTLDGGTVVVQRPGAVLDVAVVDATGAPVPDHDVFIEDARPRSPLRFLPARTNQRGRATFERLAAGQYRVWSPAVDRCGNARLPSSHVVPISGTATVETPLVVGGRATFRITTTFGPARSVVISAAPDVPSEQLPFGYRPSPAGCSGTTDANGRVTLPNFPPGPAHVDVHMPNSTYVRRVEVPSDGRTIAIDIPDGFLPVHVVDAVKNEPVAGATIAWTGSGARVEATATASGDALLEGVGTAAGELEATAPRYQRRVGELAEPPGIPYTIALTPVPPPRTLRCRVSAPSGEPIANAVVELVPVNPDEVPRVAATDANGIVTFANVAPGGFQLIANGPAGEVVVTRELRGSP